MYNDAAPLGSPADDDSEISVFTSDLVARMGKQEAARIATAQAKAARGGPLRTWVAIRKLINTM